MKRSRNSLDPCDEAIDDVLDILDRKHWKKWRQCDRNKLVDMLHEYIEVLEVGSGADSSSCTGEQNYSSAQFWRSMSEIRKHMKRSVPVHLVASLAQRPNASLDKFNTPPRRHETIVAPADAASPPTFAVDSFLCQDDDEIDELCSRGVLSRNYCRRCGSSDIGLTSFVSHSLSLRQLAFIFTCLFPMVIAKHVSPQNRALTLVDVGSRLGVVLYAAWFASAARQSDIAKSAALVWLDRIIGIEIDRECVDLQRSIIQRFIAGKEGAAQRKAQREVRVEHLDVASADGLQLLQNADIIVLNNVFEWFQDAREQLDTWLALRKSIVRCGQLIIVHPALEESLFPLILLDSAKKCAKLQPEESLSENCRDKAREFVSDWVEPIGASDAVEWFLSHEEAEVCGSSSDSSSDAGERTEQLSQLFLYKVRQR